MQEIQASLSALKLGAPQVFRNLALYPLVSEACARAGYVLLEEALERRLARVTEVSEGGRVPELAFENASAEKILLVDGDELVGAKQNRVLNLSVLVAGGARVVIPVSCVEQGRWAWRSREFSSGDSLFARARAKKMRHVSASLRDSGGRYADQGEIWADVAGKLRSSRSASATSSMADAYAARSRAIGEYVAAFFPELRQCGAVLAIDARVSGLELFDSPAAFARYLPKLVRGYALDAVETANGKVLAPPETEVRLFLERVGAAGAERFAALGEGEDIRLSAEGLAGGALASGGRVVHLAAHGVAR
ncbi:MAG: ARPP-1 family domain-containing protein [Gemmatimonadaceae bacterium]